MTLAESAAPRTHADTMAEVIVADHPAADRGPAMYQFGRFVGSWDLDVVYYDENGEIRRRTPGEWHFGWALEGRAITDVWIVPPRSERPRSGPPPGEYGMSFRFYDPDIEAWRSTWLGPVNRVVYPFIARQIDDEMVLERTDDDGALIRWIFGEITPDSFHWRAISSRDQGESWRLDQEMFATRNSKE